VKLYSYFRSSAAYRLRIALNLKGLDYQYVEVNLLQGEQKSEEYLARNPQGLVPAMELPGGDTVGQSVALLEWLEESHPQPQLLPADPIERARVRSVVNIIACDIHPICNIAVTNYLKERHDAQRDDIIAWYQHWMHRGFQAAEQVLSKNDSRYCFAEQPCMADVCLVPQVYNARRFNIPLQAFPNIERVVHNCNQLAAFQDAAPEQQPDSTL
jgi:maleylacetoacetate isomerase